MPVRELVKLLVVVGPSGKRERATEGEENGARKRAHFSSPHSPPPPSPFSRFPEGPTTTSEPARRLLT